MLNTVARYIARSSPRRRRTIRGHFETLTFLKGQRTFKVPRLRSDHRRPSNCRTTASTEVLTLAASLCPDWYRWCTGRACRNSPKKFSTGWKIFGSAATRQAAVRTRIPSKARLTSSSSSPDDQVAGHRPGSLKRTGIRLCWLATALGCNPLAFALAREEDYKPLRDPARNASTAGWTSRDQEGRCTFRAQFHPKMLNEEIGAAVARLIAANRALRTTSGWPAGCAFLYSAALQSMRACSVDRIMASQCI